MAKFVGEIVEGTPEAALQPTLKDGYVRAKRAQKLSQRYTDGYRVGGVLVGLGTLFKVIGIILAATGVLTGLLVIGSLGTAAGIACIAAGLYFGIFGLLAGVLVSSFGQMQKAMLDSAVNNSPILNDDERAAILSLD
jgi:hypothetical protein